MAYIGKGVIGVEHPSTSALTATSVTSTGAVSMASTLDVTGAITSSAGATITTDDNNAQLTLKSTDADGTVGPVLTLNRDSGSPADGDNLGQIQWLGDNDAGESLELHSKFVKLRDASDGAEDTQVFHYAFVGGSQLDFLRYGTGSAGGGAEFVINEASADIDFRVESNNLSAAIMVDAGNDRVGFGISSPSRPFEFYGNDASNYIAEFEHDGNNSNRYGMIIRCGADDSSGTNYSITFRDGDNSTQGSITFSGGTVTYGAFTAHHPCVIPNSDNDASSTENAYPYGTLLETTSISYSQKSGADTERGIRYNVQKTQSANSKAVLGAYGSSMNGGPDEETNMHQALVLGDGHILCNNAGGNIEVGDGICSSATAGIGQKATANPSMIIGIAQEAVTFASGSETKLVPVQYGLQQFIPWS